MAYEIDCLQRAESVSFADKWVAPIRSWFRATRRNYTRKKHIIHLLSYDEKVLEDIGAQPTELLRELGYDPRELPNSFGGGVHQFPYV